MNPYIILATLALAASTGFGVAWKWQAANITELELTYAEQQLTDSVDARDETERRIAAITAAQDNAQTRLRSVVDDRGRADLVGSGLRIATDEAVQASSEDAALCSDTAATLGELLTTVTQERRELSEKADRHVIDIKALKEREAAQ